MRTTATTGHLGYGAVQGRYLDAGWTPLPLPRAKKSAPPKGYTGERAGVPDDRILAEWATENRDGNVALLMPQDVIGIDIDAYHGGTDTWRTLVKRYGLIPTAPYSTSRDDGSCIKFYRVPDGTKLRGKIDGGIEIIQAHHRYAVVWPSLHPEGRTYRWYALDFTPGGIPALDSLPELPESWLEGLSVVKKDRGSTGFSGSVDDWMAALPEGRLPLTQRAFMNKVRRKFRYAGGRYDTMLSAVGTLVAWGAQGDPVEDAIVELAEAYVAAVGDERDADSEFTRALEGAIAKFGSK